MVDGEDRGNLRATVASGGLNFDCPCKVCVVRTPGHPSASRKEAVGPRAGLVVEPAFRFNFLSPAVLSGAIEDDRCVPPVAAKLPDDRRPV